MWPNPQETADLVTFTEEILNGILHFLCSEMELHWITFSAASQYFRTGVRYVLSNFYLSPYDTPSKTMKNVFYFI